MEDPLMEVRGMLTTTANAAGQLNATYGGVEIQQKIDQMIVDSINRNVDLKPLVKRKPLGQLNYHWNIREFLGASAANRKAAFDATEGQYSGTVYQSSKTQVHAIAKSLRSDYEVSNLMAAGSSSYYDALADEAQAALDDLKLAEEACMISGADTSAYGLANSYEGLLDCMRWYDTNGGDAESTNANKYQEATSLFGYTRNTTGSGDLLDVSYVACGTPGTATGVLELQHMDEAVTRSNKKGAKDSERVFFCSEERVDEINQLLQPQQRFAGTLNLEGGFTISTYKGIPIVGSRYMDKNGLTNTTSSAAGSVAESHADNAMYLLNLDQIEFRVLGGVDSQHITVMGTVGTGYQRADTQGGYFKTYGVFCVKEFHTQVVIWNVTAP